MNAFLCRVAIRLISKMPMLLQDVRGLGIWALTVIAAGPSHYVGCSSVSPAAPLPEQYIGSWLLTQKPLRRVEDREAYIISLLSRQSIASSRFLPGSDPRPVRSAAKRSRAAANAASSTSH